MKLYMKSEKKKITGKKETDTGRRKAIKKAGYYALTASTLLILMNTQVKAQSSPPMPPPDPGGFD